MPDPTKKTIEQTIAEQANEAISKGADPKEVTAQLGQMVMHLHQNPIHAQQANDAIRQGADPNAVAGTLAELASQKDEGQSSGVSGGHPAEQAHTGNIRGVAMSALNGLTLGAGDRIDAATRAVLPHALGGTHGFDYPGALKEVQSAHQDFSNTHPVTAATAEFAGSLPTIAQTAGMGRLAVPAIGAFGGVMKSDGSAKDALVEGAKGAGTAMVAGKVLEGGGKLVGSLGRAAGVPQMISKVAGKASEVVGQPLQDKLQTLSSSLGAKGTANSTILKYLANEDVAPKDVVNAVTKRLAASGEKPEILADVSPEIARLTKTMTIQPGPQRAAINKALVSRSAGTADRIAADMGSGKGVPQSIAPTFTTLVNERAKSAADHFSTAYKAGAGGLDDPELSQIMQRPTVSALWKDAQKMAADEGVKLPTKTVNGVEVPIPDVRAIHYMDQVLRQQVDNGFAGKGAIKTPGHAAILQNVISDIRGRVAQHTPEFDAALSDYSQKSELIGAMKTGSNIRKFIGGKAVADQAMGKGDPQELKSIRGGIDGLETAVQNMSPDARDLFRRSARAAIVDGIQKTPATLAGSTNPVITKVFGTSPSAARWQSLLFDNPKEAAAFQDALGRERQMAVTKATMGGSDTEANRQENAAFAPKNILSVLRHPISHASDAGDRIASEGERAALGPKLSATGSKGMTDVMTEAEKVKALRDKMSVIRRALNTAGATQIAR